jgi:aerobic carbon-monoxide dehydrogenase small subunit
LKKLIELTVNNEVYEVAIEPQQTLLEVLRENIGLTGSKEGCGLGGCGTCTVLIDGMPTLACITLADRCVGHEIMTIENQSADDLLHSLRKAFVTKGVIQCGFCTPGMIMSAYSLLSKTPSPDRGDIIRCISGNLCRCSGYKKIVEAIDEAAKEFNSRRSQEPFK